MPCELRRSQNDVERGQVAGHRLVEAEAGHARLPRRGEVRVRVERATDVAARAGSRGSSACWPVSMVSSQPSRTSRATIQSVRTTMSQPVGRPASSGPARSRRRSSRCRRSSSRVVDLDAGLGRELLEGRVRVSSSVDVDVADPVGEVERAARRSAARSVGAGGRARRSRGRRAPGVAAVAGCRASAPACRRRRGRPRSRPRADPCRKRRRVRSACDARLGRRSSVSPLGHAAATSTVRVAAARIGGGSAPASTTKQWSGRPGQHDLLARRPQLGLGRSLDVLLEDGHAVRRPASSTMYCVLTPRYDASRDDAGAGG